MNKLNISNAVITLAVGFMILPGQGLSNEFTDNGEYVADSNLSQINSGYENEKHSLDEINIYINELVDDNSHGYNAKAKSNRQDVENLVGEWTLSYRAAGLSYTDKMAIKEVVFSDGEYAAVGDLNTQQYGSGHRVACLKQPQQLIDILGTDYACVSRINGSYLTYSFKYSNNKITKGLYAFGSTIENVAEDLLINKVALTGHRGSEPTGIASPIDKDAKYDELTHELTIPSLIYLGSKYRVILESKGDFVFTVKSANPIN